MGGGGEAAKEKTAVDVERGAGMFRGARASRVLAKASRLRELSKRSVSDFVHRIRSGAAGKFVETGRLNQHARRARYPDMDYGSVDFARTK